MIADKIKLLRERNEWTQTELAKKLGITRSGVNAWEMGISIPSTQYIVELSLLFNVSADFLLGIKNTASVPVDGLTDKEIVSIMEIIACYKENKMK
ncbi:MAG: helix-turn-helix transcriptional regulator [Clostridia bacterium]|nr:helix-turn-helix transcriptional regulator [Clostridia bacterium]